MKTLEKISEEIIYRLDSIARGRCNYEYGLPTIPDCEEMKEMKKAIEEILKPYLKSEWKNAFEVYPEHDQKFLTDSQRIIRARRYDCMIVNGRPVLTMISEQKAHDL